MTSETIKWFLGLLLTSAIFEKILDRIFVKFDKKKDKSDKILEHIDMVEKKLDGEKISINPFRFMRKKTL